MKKYASHQGILCMLRQNQNDFKKKMFCLSESSSSARLNLRDLKWDNICAWTFSVSTRAVEFVFRGRLLLSLNVHPHRAWSGAQGLCPVLRRCGALCPGFGSCKQQKWGQKQVFQKQSVFSVLLRWAVREAGRARGKAKSLQAPGWAGFSQLTVTVVLVYLKSNVILNF